MRVNLQNLVLRGVSVQRDGQTIGLRLVCKAGVGAPAVLVSMRHPSRGERQAGNEPAGRPGNAVSDRVDRDAPGAGRSLRGAGALRGGSLASSAGAPLTAASGSTAKARALPPTGFTTRPGGMTRYSAMAPAWCQPAGRTRPASTRGKAAR
jgi:hypothetical protein